MLLSRNLIHWRNLLGQPLVEYLSTTLPFFRMIIEGQFDDVEEEVEHNDALDGLKSENSELEKMQLENKKLSKSRDRLKSLLDEKEKMVNEIQGEKERAEGSQEQVRILILLNSDCMFELIIFYI